MGKQAYFSELERALARPDADKMCRHLDVYADYHQNDGEWTEGVNEAFGDVSFCEHQDHEKAFAYVILGASRSDHPGFLGQLGCGPLEDLLRDPPAQLLDRVVAEARKSARFRWLLSHPFKVAIADRAWDAIEKFRSTGPHEEPPAATLPPRD